MNVDTNIYVFQHSVVKHILKLDEINVKLTFKIIICFFTPLID